MARTIAEYEEEQKQEHEERVEEIVSSISELDKAMFEILYFAHLVNEKTKYGVFMHYSGHVGPRLDLHITESKEHYNRHVLTAEVQTAYSEERKTWGLELADLKAKAKVLRRVLIEQRIPLDEVNVEEYLVEHLTF